MLEGIDFRRDYGEIFEEAKKKAMQISRNPLDEEVILKAQAGDKDALNMVYLYYEPVIDYVYLKHSPMYDDELEKEELIPVFMDALRRATKVYKKDIYGTFYQCVEIWANREEKRYLKRIRSSRREFNNMIIDGDIDRVAVVKECKGADMLSVVGRLMCLLNNKERELMLHLANGGDMSEYAREYGITRQAVRNRLIYARRKINSVFLPCKQIASSFYLGGKSVRQIAKENNLSRLQVHYYLKYYNYLYNGEPMPIKIVDAQKYEKGAVSRCVLNIDEKNLYDAFSDYGCDMGGVPSHVRAQYTGAYLSVETARTYMRKVVDCNDESNPDRKRDIEVVLNLNSKEREFYLQLYKHVMMGCEPPILTDEIEGLIKRSTEQASHDVIIRAREDVTM